jgi:phytoene synthase
MSAAATSKESAAFCADLVRTHDFARYAATLFLPQATRRALLSIYAFNVEISRVREQVSQPLPGEMRMQWWTDMLQGAGHGGVEGNPVAAELRQTISDFRLPVEPLTRLIEEHQFDLYNDPMPSMAALEGYATETSSALFSLGARIAAPPSAVIDHLARHAGLAQGIEQVIAALPLDAARRQLFVPLQLLQQHGGGIEEVFSGKQTPRVRAAIDQLAEDARKHLGTAIDLLDHLQPPVRRMFLPLALVRRDLMQMSRAEFDPFVPQPTSRLRTWWTLWRASRTKEFGGEVTSGVCRMPRAQICAHACPGRGAARSDAPQSRDP